MPLLKFLFYLIGALDHAQEYLGYRKAVSMTVEGKPGRSPGKPTKNLQVATELPTMYM